MLAHLRAHGIDTVEGFVAALPRLHRTNFVLVYESEALFPEAISHDAPRVVSWGAGADIVFSWAVDAESAIGDSVEFLEASGDRWVAGVVDFGGDEPRITEPASCASCHGVLGKPLWGQGGSWRGTEAEVRELGGNRYVVRPALDALERAAVSTSPRLAPLAFDPARTGLGRRVEGLRGATDGVRRFEVAREIGNMLTFRHERVLAERLRGRPDYAEAAREVVCHDDPEGMLRHFALVEHNIAVRADTGELVQGSELSPIEAFQGYGASAGMVFRYFVLDDLRRRDGRVAEAVREQRRLLDQLHADFHAYPSGRLAAQRGRWYPTISHPREFLRRPGLVALQAAYRNACRVLREQDARPGPVPGEVSELALVNPGTGAVLGRIDEGAVLGRASAGGALALQATAGPGVASVGIDLTAVGTATTYRGGSSARPFTVDFGAPARTGEYYVTATPYPEPDLRGNPGRPRTTRFTLAEGGADGRPAGAWSDGTTLWTADRDAAVLRAHRLATGESLGRTLTLATDNAAPTGLWSDGSLAWVSDADSGRLHAYRLADGATAPGRDIALAAENGRPTGLWSNHETVWVADGDDSRLYAYDLVLGSRKAGSDLQLAAGNDDPVDLWSGGGAWIWVADGEDAKAYAYGTTGRAPDLDIEPPDGTPALAGLWSDRQRAWLVPADGSDFVVVPLPEPGREAADGAVAGFAPSAPLELTELTVAGTSVQLSDGQYRYVVAVGGAERATVVAAAPAGAAVEVVPGDADADADGHQVDLPDGFSRLRVYVRRGTRVVRYAVVVYRGDPDAALEVALEPAVVSEGETAGLTVTMRGGFGFDDTQSLELSFSGSGAEADDYEVPARRLSLPAYTASASTAIKAVRDSQAESEERLVVTAGVSGLRGSGTLTIRESTAPENLDMLAAAGNRDPRGIWSDGDTLWVADGEDDRLYAYALAGGARREARDIVTLAEAGNADPRGVWSDGETLWVADGEDFKVYAYALADGSRQEARDLAADLSWLSPKGVWGDGGMLLLLSQETGESSACFACTSIPNTGTQLGARLADGTHLRRWTTSRGGSTRGVFRRTYWHDDWPPCGATAARSGPRSLQGPAQPLGPARNRHGGGTEAG